LLWRHHIKPIAGLLGTVEAELPRDQSRA